MSQINIFFWSKRCEGSIALKRLMENENILQYFYVYCIDPEDIAKTGIKIPTNLVTPTIMIKGNPTPYSQQDAFFWLAKIKQWKSRMMMQKMSSAQNNFLSKINNNLPNENENVIGYNKSEMGSITDSFSFYSTDINKECDDALPQSFFSVNNLGKENIFTPPLENGTYKVGSNKKCKLSEEESKKLTTECQKQRNHLDNIIKEQINNFRNQIYQS